MIIGNELPCEMFGEKIDRLLSCYSSLSCFYALDKHDVLSLLGSQPHS